MALAVADPSGTLDLCPTSHWCSASATLRDFSCGTRFLPGGSSPATSRSMSYNSPKNFSAFSPTRLPWLAHNSWNLRRACAMMLEQNDEWSLNRRYMQLEGLQTLRDTVPTGLPAVAR
jgi:hypothetical protein